MSSYAGAIRGPHWLSFPGHLSPFVDLKLYQEGSGSCPVKCRNPPASSSSELTVIMKIAPVSMGSED